MSSKSITALLEKSKKNCKMLRYGHIGTDHFEVIRKYILNLNFVYEAQP